MSKQQHRSSSSRTPELDWLSKTMLNVGWLTSAVTNSLTTPVNKKIGLLEEKDLYGRLSKFDNIEDVGEFYGKPSIFTTPDYNVKHTNVQHLSSGFLLKTSPAAFEESKSHGKKLVHAHWLDHVSTNRSNDYEKISLKTIPSFTARLKEGEMFEIEPLKASLDILKAMNGDDIEPYANFKNEMMNNFKKFKDDTFKAKGFDDPINGESNIFEKAFSTGVMNFKGQMSTVVIQKEGFEGKYDKEGKRIEHAINVIHGYNTENGVVGSSDIHTTMFKDSQLNTLVKIISSRAGTPIIFEPQQRNNAVDNYIEKAKINLATKNSLKNDSEMFPFTMVSYDNVNDPSSFTKNIEERRELGLVWRYSKDYDGVTTYHTGFTDIGGNDIAHKIPLSEKELFGKSSIHKERRSTLQLRGVAHMHNTLGKMEQAVKDEHDETIKQLGVESNKNLKKGIFYGTQVASAYATNHFLGKHKPATTPVPNDNQPYRTTTVVDDTALLDFAAPIQGGDRGVAALLGIGSGAASAFGTIGALVPMLTIGATALYNGHQYWNKQKNLDREAKTAIPFAKILLEGTLDNVEQEMTEHAAQSNNERVKQNTKASIALIRNSYTTGTPLDISTIHELTRDTERRETDPDKSKHYDSSRTNKVNFDGYHDDDTELPSQSSTSGGVHQMGSRRHKVQHSVYKSGFDSQQKTTHAGTTAFTHNLKLSTKRKRQ